jgi:WS/DGAT/MGAT family acyltransferase
VPGTDAAADPSGREVFDEPRMSDMEALMWTLEKDPHLSATFASVTVLDAVPDFERFRRKMIRAVNRIPRLRQRVVPGGLGRLAPPAWQDDPSFDIDYHVSRMALPAPGTERELFDLAARLAQDPFDRTRPLWEFHIVEGLEGDRAALFQKMHHTITDGEGGIRLSERFIDAERHPDEKPTADLRPRPEPPAPSGLLQTAGRTLGHLGGKAGRGVKDAAEGLADVVRHPTELPQKGAGALTLSKALAKQMTPTDGSKSPLWQHRTQRRRMEAFRIPFDPAHSSAKALGVSVNDLFVTGALRGAARYHADQGAELHELRVAMPVSTRTGGLAGGNSFTPARVVLPTDLQDPAEHLRAVSERLGITKRDPALRAAEGLAGVANVLPVSVLTRFVRQQAESVDITTSNVRAAPFDLFIAGARIEATYPLGPLAGTAFNLTTMSYCGSLDMGLHIDTGAVQWPALLRDHLADAYAELVAAGGGDQQ